MNSYEASSAATDPLVRECEWGKLMRFCCKLDEMRDLYSAENQLVKALPKTLKAVSDEKMKELLTEHLEQTKGQVERLKQIFEGLGEKPTGKHCNGMEGCIKEVTEALEEGEEGALKDAGIIGASLRTERYEIAGYSAAIAMAKTLKEEEIVKHLNESLHEEQVAAKNILSSATSILKEANAQESSKSSEEDEEEKPGEKESKKKSEEDEKEAEAVESSTYDCRQLKFSQRQLEFPLAR